jgi:RNA polymerase sigma-70 factor (ECF subfamily)
VGDDETPDSVLVRRFQAGDETAFDALHLRYRPRLWRACRAAGADAEDVVQETFLLLWQALRRLPEDVRVYPYAYVVARRLVHTTVARRSLVELVAEVDVADVSPGWDDDGLGPALAGLPDDQRTAVEHHVGEGLPRPATAALLGVTPRQVDVLVGRALHALRDAVR